MPRNASMERRGCHPNTEKLGEYLVASFLVALYACTRDGTYDFQSDFSLLIKYLTTLRVID